MRKKKVADVQQQQIAQTAGSVKASGNKPVAAPAERTKIKMKDWLNR
jgi:hypothetical protein